MDVTSYEQLKEVIAAGGLGCMCSKAVCVLALQHVLELVGGRDQLRAAQGGDRGRWVSMSVY